jgi:hypothetical protein
MRSSGMPSKPQASSNFNGCISLGMSRGRNLTAVSSSPVVSRASVDLRQYVSSMITPAASTDVAKMLTIVALCEPVLESRSFNLLQSNVNLKIYGAF